MTRPLYPRRDTMREWVLIAAGKWIGVTVIVGACFLGPDAIVSWVTG